MIIDWTERRENSEYLLRSGGAPDNVCDLRKVFGSESERVHISGDSETYVTRAQNR